MSTTTKARTTTALTNGNVKNAGWSLSNEADIKKNISPFEFLGLQQCINKLFADGVKFMPLYKQATKLSPATWVLNNAPTIEKSISGFEFTGLRAVVGNLLVKDIKLQIVYKNVAKPAMKHSVN